MSSPRLGESHSALKVWLTYCFPEGLPPLFQPLSPVSTPVGGPLSHTPLHHFLTLANHSLKVLCENNGVLPQNLSIGRLDYTQDSSVGWPQTAVLPRPEKHVYKSHRSYEATQVL